MKPHCILLYIGYSVVCLKLLGIYCYDATSTNAWRTACTVKPVIIATIVHDFCRECEKCNSNVKLIVNSNHRLGQSTHFVKEHLNPEESSHHDSVFASS